VAVGVQPLLADSRPGVRGACRVRVAGHTAGDVRLAEQSQDVRGQCFVIVGRREKGEPDLLKASVQAFEVFEDARPFWPE